MHSLHSPSNSEPARFGLTLEDINEIINVLKAYAGVEGAIIFGSRAKGTHKPGSDVDIALIGDNLERTITQISYQLNEELTLPYFFDVIDYTSISHPDLKEHIDRVGIRFYSRGE